MGCFPEMFRAPHARSLFSVSRRFASSEPMITQRMRELIPPQQEKVKNLRKNHGDKVLGQYTVGQAYGGMRGIIGLVYETSLLDSNEGIHSEVYLFQNANNNYLNLKEEKNHSQ